MTANPVRLQAIAAVEAYTPPPISFDPGEEPGEIFGANVFSLTVMQKRLPKIVYKSVLVDDREVDAARPRRRRRRRLGDEGLGAGEGRDPLRPRLLPADRPDRREARQLPRPGRRRHGVRVVLGQDPDPGRARRVQLPQRRPAQHLRGARLHRLGRDEPGVRAGEPQRQHPVHPDDLHLDDRRGARPQDAGAALAAGDGGPRQARAEALRPRRPRERRGLLRPRAGVLPGRQPLLPGAPRPAQRRPHALRRQAAQGPGVRRPLLRRHPRARARLHDGHRAGALQARHPGQDPPQRGRARPVRGRADVRARQRGLRPPAAADDDVQGRRQEARHGVPVPREAVRRRQRLGQARQLLARQLRARQPARARRQPARQRPVPRVLRRGHPRGPQVRRPAARLGRLGVQRPPPRRQRGAAGDHLDLPRRPARRRLRPDRQGRRDPLEGEGHAHHRRRHPAQPDQGPGRPQPHLAVRLHRQPLRVPRARAPTRPSPARWS